MEKLRGKKMVSQWLLPFPVQLGRRGAGASRHSRQAKVAESLAELLDELLANVVLLVVLLVVVALLNAGVAADGADVDHAVAELDKGAALDGDVEVGDVVQAEADELLVLGLAEPADEAVGGQLLAVLVGGQAVLGEAEVEEGGDGHVRGAQLLLLLGQVAAAHEADGALLAQAREQVQHLGRDAAPRRRQGAIDVEEADGVLEGPVLERGVADDHGGRAVWDGTGGGVLVSNWQCEEA